MQNGLAIPFVFALAVALGVSGHDAEARAKKPFAKNTCECQCRSDEKVRLISGFLISRYSGWGTFETAGLCVAFNGVQCTVSGHPGTTAGCDDKSGDAARSAPIGVAPTIKGN